MSTITLEVLTSPACSRCEEFLRFWDHIAPEWRHVSFKEVSLLTPEGQLLAQEHRILAAPGVIIDGALFASGSIDHTGVLERLQALSLS